MTSFTIPIPTYQCHKRVQALRIKAVVPNPRGYELHFEDGRFCPIEVCSAWVEHKGAGVVGGYAVWYGDDGYLSWSPAAAFEAGYTLVDDAPTQPRKSLIASTPEGRPASVFIRGDDGSDEFAIDGLTKAQADAVYGICVAWARHNIVRSEPAGPATQAAREVGL